MKINFKYKAVYVEWIDSTMRKTVWHSNEEVFEGAKYISSKFQTISYLINKNKLEYIFASSIHFEENKAVAFGQIFTIPKGCVTKMRNIKIKDLRT